MALIVHLQPLAESPAASPSGSPAASPAACPAAFLAASRDAAHGNDNPDAEGSSSAAADGPTAAAARSAAADGLGTAPASSSAAANSSYAAGGSGDNVEAAHVCDAAAGSCASCCGAPTANSGAAAAAYSDASTASAGSRAAAACSCRLVVATTHICFDPNKGDVKLGQVRELISRVHDQLRRTPGSVAIIAGDFNMVPCCPLYEFITSGRIDLADYARKRLSGQVTDCAPVVLRQLWWLFCLSVCLSAAVCTPHCLSVCGCL